MKKATLTMLLLLTLTAGPALAGGAVGETAPAFQLKDLNGKTHSLADYKGKVVVLEWVNPNCPFSDRHAKEKTMSNLVKKHGGNGKVVWLGINSTSASHSNFLEPAEHKAWATKNGVNYTVLYDETGKVGKAYDAKTTPHLYIVDEQGKISYNGAIDDDPSGRTTAAQRTNYVDGGLIAELANKKLDPAATKPYGCSIKY